MGQEQLVFNKIWFFSHCSVDRLIEVSKVLDKSTFNSVMLPFKAGWADPITKSLAVLFNTDKINAIAALPGYAATPEYVSMINQAIKEIFPSRKFYINIIDGGVLENPTIFGIDKQRQDVKEINNKFVSELLGKQDVPLLFSGKSRNTYENVLKYGEMQLILFEDLPLIDTSQYSTLCVRIFVCVKDTDSEASLKFNEMINLYENDKDFSPALVERIRKNIIFGSKESVLEKINDLKNMGICGILVSDMVGSNTEEEVISALEGVL